MTPDQILLLQFTATLVAPVLLVIAWDGVRSLWRGRRRGPAPAPAGAAAMSLRVQRIVDATADTRVFELVPAAGASLPAWSAGAHVDVRLDDGTVRQYSLCGAPGARDVYRIAVKHVPDSRGGSRAMHERVRVGQVLAVSAPRNHFALADGARHHVLLAAGIGITPVFAMVQALQARGASYELHYFTRSVADTAFHEVLSAAPYQGRVHFHHGVGTRLRELLQSLLGTAAQGHHLYVCGPRRFMVVVDELTAGVWPPEAVHVEHFGADPAAGPAPSAAFEVRLDRSQRTIPVAADCSIVDALCAHGVAVATACREGVCGTCVTGLLAGTPDHRDLVLSAQQRQAGDRIAICVSRAKSAQLVLDL